MSNVTKLPEDSVRFAKFRLLLSSAKVKLRVLAVENRVLKTENRNLKIDNKKLNQEIAKLDEIAALVPTLQEEVKRLIAELEKCRRSKQHSGNSFPPGPQSWMA